MPPQIPIGFFIAGIILGYVIRSMVQSITAPDPAEEFLDEDNDAK